MSPIRHVGAVPHNGVYSIQEFTNGNLDVLEGFAFGLTL